MLLVSTFGKSAEDKAWRSAGRCPSSILPGHLLLPPIGGRRCPEAIAEDSIDQLALLPAEQIAPVGNNAFPDEAIAAIMAEMFMLSAKEKTKLTEW